MTDAEIIKALECCAESGDFTKTQDEICSPCPYCNCGDCTGLLKANALDLINRQKAIIEKSEKVEHFADKTIATQQAENERLQDAIDEQDIEIASLWKRIEDAKAEAYKECIDKIQNQIKNNNAISAEWLRKYLDNLLKELSGEYKPPKTETQIKFEAYRECIEKIKQRAEYCSYSVAVNTIADNVLKDLEGENKCE